MIHSLNMKWTVKRLEITREAVRIRQREKNKQTKRLPMATLQFTFTDSTTLFRPSLPSTRTFSRNRSLIVKASPSSSDDFSKSRRRFIAETAALSVSLPQLEARAEDALSEWERVYLPIDPGVVLLDIAFVPDDPNHGIVNS